MTYLGDLLRGVHGRLHFDAKLRESNGTIAVLLVRARGRSYARALSGSRDLEGGGEGLRRKHGPNNYINDLKKKNWAAFVRPIFLELPIANSRGQP